MTWRSFGKRRCPIADYTVRIAVDLRIVRDAVIQAENELKARFGIQTLINNGLYDAVWAMAGQAEFVNVHIVSIEEIDE